MNEVLETLSSEEIDQVYFECGELNRPSLNYLNERLVQAQREKDYERMLELAAVCPFCSKMFLLKASPLEQGVEVKG